LPPIAIYYNGKIEPAIGKNQLAISFN